MTARLPLFFDNYDKVEGIVKDLGLDIEFDENGKLIYREKSQLYHIVNLMSDAYFKSLLYRSKWVQSITVSDVMESGQVVENPMIGAIPSRNEVQRELDDLLMSM